MKLGLLPLLLKSRFVTEANKKRHLLERTDVEAASFVGRKDKMWEMIGSGRPLNISFETKSNVSFEQNLQLGGHQDELETEKVGFFQLSIVAF